MNKPMIENSDRGITLNKTLAWGIASSLVVGGLWVGIELTTLSGNIQNLTDQYRSLVDRQAEDRLDIRSQGNQINQMQTQSARVEQRLNNIEAATNRTDTNVAEILRELRQGRILPSNGFPTP
jgi:septal ring factor EnvC (AmiA/AmiB activator)